MTLLLAQLYLSSKQKSNCSGTVFNTKNHHFRRNSLSLKILVAFVNGEGEEKAHEQGTWRIEELWPSFCIITCSIRCRNRLLEDMEPLRGREGH
jgi:hypothetical protein